MTTTDHEPRHAADHVTPLAGPLDVAPPVSRRAAYEMLDAALERIDLGVFDLFALRAIRKLDPFRVASVASMLARAQAGGYHAGYRDGVTDAAVNPATAKHVAVVYPTAVTNADDAPSQGRLHPVTAPHMNTPEPGTGSRSGIVR